MEFAEGNFGLIEAALDYAQGHHGAETTIEYSAAQTSGDPINYRFNWDGEAAVIYYTTDGSTPIVGRLPRRCGRACEHTTTKCYNGQGPRMPGEVLTLSTPGAHTVKWIVARHQGQPVERSRRSGCWSRPTTPTAPSAAPCRRRWRCRSARRRRSARSPRASPKDYTAGTTANVISTAGDATLSVADPSPTNTGQLVNGTFSCRRRCRRRRPASAAPAAAGGAGRRLGRADDAADLQRPGLQRRGDVTFKQTIGANDALRTGAYSKTLTFTLSTDEPVRSVPSSRTPPRSGGLRLGDLSGRVAARVQRSWHVDTPPFRGASRNS